MMIDAENVGKIEDDDILEVYDVTVEVPLTLHFKVEAKDEEDAAETANNKLREMRFKTYVHNYDGRSAAEMLGLENSHGQPCNDVTFDYPERPSWGEVSIEADQG